ncbi:MAG TPA: glucose 1-dehydrogenase [Chloroflexota bacterium]|nr:glucose 1-dehydrogenase [Chloroflexota bacterium]
MTDTNGKSVIITGAGRGIGRAIALRLARDGFSIMINDLDAGPAGEVVAEIEAAGGFAIINGANVTDEDQVAAMVEQAAAEFGQVDVMIANAGIGVQKRIIEMTLDDFDKILKVNLYGVFLCGREAARHMVPRKQGKIIFAASTSGRRGAPFQSAYCSSKFGVVGLTQSMAKELGPEGITVNAYCPGIVNTRMWEEVDRERSRLMGKPPGTALQQAIDSIALGRMEEPEDVAKFVSFLAGPDSDYVTGQAMLVCGGVHMA